MALISCSECKKEISDSAKSCPNCGAKPKKTHWFTKVIAVLFGLWALGQIALMMTPEPEVPSSPYEIEQARLKAENQEDRIRAKMGSEAIKENMRNPDSFKLTFAGIKPKTKVICYEYRAENGFGGMNIEQSILGGNDKWIAIGASPNIESAWNKHCAGDINIITDSR